MLYQLDAHLLDTLYLSFPKYSTISFNLHLPQSVRNLSLSSVSFTANSAAWAQLTVLSIDYKSEEISNGEGLNIGWNKLVRILSQTSRLQRLEFSCQDNPVENRSAPPLVLLELQKLSVNIRWKALVAFLSRLEAPSMTTVDIVLADHYLDGDDGNEDNGDEDNGDGDEDGGAGTGGGDDGDANPDANDGKFNSIASVTTVKVYPNSHSPRLTSYDPQLTVMKRLVRSFNAVASLHLPLDLAIILLEHPTLVKSLNHLTFSPPFTNSRVSDSDLRKNFIYLVEWMKYYRTPVEGITLVSGAGEDIYYRDWEQMEWHAEWPASNWFTQPWPLETVKEVVNGDGEWGYEPPAIAHAWNYAVTPLWPFGNLWQ